jgi:hypothetical protein
LPLTVSIPEDCHARDFRQHLLEQLQALADQLGLQSDNSGYVAARPAKTGNQTGGYRVVIIQNYNDGDGAGGLLYHPCDRLGSRDDNIDLEFDKLLRQRRQPIRPSLSGSVLDLDVLTFDVPQLSESCGA